MFSIPLFAYGKRFFSFTLHEDFRSHRSRFRLRYCKGLWILHHLHLLLQFPFCSSEVYYSKEQA